MRAGVRDGLRRAITAGASYTVEELVTRRPGPLDYGLVLALPGFALALMGASAERFWVVAAFLWWFGLAALPGMLVMARLTRGRGALAVLLVGLVALAASCAANLELLDRCGESCEFARDPR